MKYELIIFDIGKTLYDKNFSVRASDCVLNDIKALRKKGLKVGVCTMRTIQHCKKVVPVELDFYISLNLFNGKGKNTCGCEWFFS